MTSRKSRVAVIGAGISGVLAAAHLRRAGINPVVFERSREAGGIWYVSNSFTLLIVFKYRENLPSKVV